MFRRINVKNINLIFLIIVLMLALIEFCMVVLSQKVDILQFAEMSMAGFLKTGLLLIWIFLCCIFMVVVKNFELVTLYVLVLSVVLADRAFHKEKMDITDKKTDEYYRHLLDEYSAAMIGYLNDFEITVNELVASIMMLELKKKIVIENNIKVIDTDDKNLSLNEKYLLNKLKKNETIRIKDFKNNVYQDAMTKELLLMNDKYKNNTKKTTIIFLITTFLVVVATFILFARINVCFEQELLEVNDFFEVLAYFLIIFILGIIYSGYLIYYCCYIIKINKEPWVRSKKGKELNKKINGLKNFLQEFSLIHEKEHKELTIWEDYLVYSVLFGRNNDVRDRILEKIEIINFDSVR